METFLSFLNGSLQKGKVLTIACLSEIFEQFIISVWAYHGWDYEEVPMPKFFWDDEDDDEAWSPDGKHRATPSPSSHSRKRSEHT